MIVKVIICLAIGYLFGCFQTGYFYGKLLHGVDVRNYGSGNAGTTNTLRTLGKTAGYIVFLGDALKAVFAVYIVRYLLFAGTGDVLKILETITALGVVLGHNYPFYMNFKGGKGIAATGGFMFALDIRIALIAAIVFAVVFFTTRYVSVGSLVITAMFPVLILIFYPGQWVVFGLSLIFTAMAWWRHRANIRRLMNGTENRFEKKKK
jgi:glycerol-3-phosphate acyltransferase PlsY